MKNLIIALLLLAAVVTGVCKNASFVLEETSRMEELLSEPGGGDRVLEKLKENEFLLSLSSNHVLLEQAMQYAADLAAFEADPALIAEAKAAKEKLLLVISEIRGGEKITFSGIF